MGQAFLIDETNKNTLQVSHFINIYLEQAISRKNDRTDVIRGNEEKVIYTPIWRQYLHTNMMSVLEEAGRYIACHINIWKTTFQIYQ